MRKPKSHYRETKVRRLIIVTGAADPSSSRRKREMEDAKQRGYTRRRMRRMRRMTNRRRERGKMRDGRQHTVVVKGPCGTNKVARPLSCHPPVDLLRFLSSNEARFFHDSTRFIYTCTSFEGAYISTDL